MTWILRYNEFELRIVIQLKREECQDYWKKLVYTLFDLVWSRMRAALFKVE